MTRPHWTLAALWIAALAVPLALVPRQASALDIPTPSPVHSYFEGLRGRLPLWTPATPDDPLSAWINPACLGTGRARGIGYLHTYNDSTVSGSDAFVIALGGMAFGAEFMKLRETPFSFSTKSARRYTLASAQRLFKGAYLGTSYSWLSSEISELDRASTWSAGLLVRPTRALSLGLVARDLNSPTYYGNKLKPIVEASLGFRPVGERLTVFTTYYARGSKLEIRNPAGNGDLIETQPESFFTYGIEFEPVSGLVVRVGADEDENINTSVTLLAGNLGLGSSFTRLKADKKTEKTYGTATLTTLPFWHESALMPRNGYLEIDLGGSIAETRPPLSLLGGGGPRYTLRELLDRIERAKASPEVNAILLRCSGVSANFTILDELRQALVDFRSSGKQAVAFAESPGNGAYYLASACDYIIIIPNGYLGLVGLKAEGLFLKGTLDKLGVEAKFTKAGKYKSAVEALTEDQFTEPSREAENALLDDIYAKFVRDIAQGRNMTEEALRQAIDAGPYIPAEAVKAGLVDTVAYWDQVPDIVNKVLHAGSRRMPYQAFARRNYGSDRWGERPVVGIVYAVGSIEPGASRRDMLLGDIMGSETMTKAIKAMREDKSVKALIMRVDSPGGVMAASDLIRREIELTRKEKPVIVSMGGVAASGGYHISCPAGKILASEATITGSIGVFNLWLHTRGLYQKLGVNKEIFTRGKHADPMPSWRDVTEEDMNLMQYFVDQYYAKFVDDVAKGRGMKADSIKILAQGRVWSGKAALQNGLVDGIGGLTVAIQAARDEAGIPADEEIQLRVLPGPGGFLERLAAGTQARVLGRLGRVEMPENLRDLLKEGAYLSAFDEPFLYLAPYTLDIK